MLSRRYFETVLITILVLYFTIISSSAHPQSDDLEDHFEFEQKILLGDLETEEYHKLSEDEKAGKLRALAEKIDQDSNGTITAKELADWIERNHIAYVVKRSRTFFEDTDEDVDGFVTFAEYEKSQYSHPQVPNDYKNSKLYRHEKRRFEYADRDVSGNLTLKEYVYFLHPEEGRHMLDCIVQETIENMDRDGDNLISVKDYMGESVLDMNKEEFLRSMGKFKHELDKNGDGLLDKEEMTAWIIPERRSTANTETKHLLEHGDKDKDGQLSYDEIIAMGQLLETSKATQYGELLNNIPIKQEL